VRGKSALQTVLDMVRSLGLIAVIVAITLIFVPNLVHPGKSSKLASANYSDDTVGFRQVTHHDALAPVGLPKGWYANGATFANSGTKTAHLHIGWVTPNKKYAGLDESNATAPAFIVTVLGKAGAHVTGQVAIAGASWAERTSGRGERSLTTTTPDGITIVITGSASAVQQQQLAAALQPDTRGIH
jgi:hypothetical protein